MCRIFSGTFWGLETMKRIIAQHQRLLVVSVMFLLVGVGALSGATRRPCLQACSGPWHICKAGRMAEPQPLAMPITNATESAEVVVAEPEALHPRYAPREEALLVALPVTFQKHHFRSPPPVQ
jgi:hypothetical protein